MSKPQLLSALNFGALLVHQYEEYVDPGWFPGQFNGGVFKSDQPRNYPLSKSTALGVNTAFACPYYILPILFPRKKPPGLSPAIFGIMQSVMHGVIVPRIAGGKYSPGFLASFFLHIPLGVTCIRALKAAEGLTRGDLAKSAACTVAFAASGSLARTSSGRTRTPRTCEPGNRWDRTMLNQPDARACRGTGRRPCDTAGHASGKRVTRSGFGVCETETMTNDLARGRAQGRGPQYEQA